MKRPNQQHTVSAFSFQGPSVAFSRWLSLLKMYSSLIFLFFKTNPECLGLSKKPQATPTILVKRDKFNVCFGLFIRIVDRERKMRNISRLILIQHLTDPFFFRPIPADLLLDFFNQDPVLPQQDFTGL